jgi:hypothetical protein
MMRWCVSWGTLVVCAACAACNDKSAGPPASAQPVRLPKTMRAQVDAAAIPVLVPADAALVEAGTIIVEQSFYAFNVRAGGITVTVQGTRPSIKVEGVAPNPGNVALRSGKGFVTENEGIRTTSFVENGIAYSVDVECEDLKDTRCASDRFVVDLTNGLVYVGGKTQ